MEIAIGLPATVPGVDRDALLSWARRGEERGFSSLATLDRLVYPNYDPLVALGAAAAVTERVRLLTNVINVPWRNNAALLAKQAATVDSLSGGRLSLGVGLGARDDDYAASGASMRNRGRQLDEALEVMKRAWSGEPLDGAGNVGPPPAREGGPELLVGGGVEASFRRAARYGDGWTMSGAPPEQLAEAREQVLRAWREEGREGQPRIVALCYFALGERAREMADADLLHYYAWLGDDVARQIAQSAVVDEEMARRYRDAFAAAGADELCYFPTGTDVEQVDRLADAVLDSGRELSAA
jgi:alkanesulfonate monooxygenase SsuD/methylene tetrahydromethanopterin reductase-like flavin-dependent oxidoreductase (luciferase family)